jgi:hypothetical protein
MEFLPNIAYADFDKILGNINSMIINPIIDLLFALAVVFFLWGCLEFLMNQGNEEKRTAGKSHMLWGIVGITIMMGVFFIMNMILNTLGVKGINVEENKVDIKLPN